MRIRLLLVSTMAALAASAASAQTPPPPLPRAVLSVNYGVQGPARTFSDTFTFDRYLETARVQADYDVKVKPFFDGGLAVPIWRSIGLGFTVSRFSATGTAAVQATIPHPFFFDQDRTISGEATDVVHDETAVHAQLVAFVPAGSRLLLALSAGPTVLTVEQSFVTMVNYDESYPFDTATYRSATLQRERKSKVGFNAGADVTVKVTASIGVGVIVRYSRAPVTFDVNGHGLKVDSGGLQAGGGIRVMF